MIRSSAVLALLLVVALSASLGCSKDATADGEGPDPNQLIWRQLAFAMTDVSITRVAVLKVEDQVEHRADVERQVQQAVLDALTGMTGLVVVEADRETVDHALTASDTEAGVGIPAEVASDLCATLAVDGFVYATVENSEFDVNVKVYLKETGNVIFSKTLQDLELPLSAKPARKPVENAPTTETLAQGEEIPAA